MKKRLLSLLACVFAVFACAVAQDAVPQVIPALQSWKSKKGKLVLPQQGKIVIDPAASSEVKDAASIFASDLDEMFGFKYDVVEGKPSKNDIYITISDKDKEHGNECYRMTIDKQVKIAAPTVAGAFWGTRTLLQMMHNQPEGLQKGETLDYPEYRDRGFMLDVGRKFFTMDYLEKTVKLMAFYKMNLLQVHLNDNAFVEDFNNDWNLTYSAFRLESESFPGLTALDGSYTKDEFRNFQKMALRYGIMVVPEIDVPAHSLAFTQFNPRLAADKKEYGMDHLDLYKEEVYEFLDTLFAEYVGGEDPVFVGPYVNIGTDEYDLHEGEQFRKFSNYYIDYIAKFGKRPRIWGSLNMMKGETQVDLTKCDVNAWNYGWMGVDTVLKQGGTAINLCDWYLYIVPGVHSYYQDFLDAKWLYETWKPNKMNSGNEWDSDDPNFLGVMFALWNDHAKNGISQQDAYYRTFPAMQVVSERLWRGNNSANVPYSQFEALCKTTPEAPGVNVLARVNGTVEVTAPGEVIKLTGKDSIGTEVDAVGYPYSVEFEIYADKEGQVRSGILFQDDYSKFLTNWGGAGKFAFERDGYINVFHGYSLPAETWVKVRIEGDHESTSLYVNDKLVECLGIVENDVYNKRWDRIDPFWYYQTLVFPLQQVGDKNIGFKGQVRNVKCGQVEK